MNVFMGSIRNAPLAAVTGAMAFAMTAGRASAENGKNIGEIAGDLTGQLENIGKLVMGAAFVAGLAFVGIGLARLKAAVDSQGQQVKYGEGLWRIGLGAALVALPAVIAVTTDTFGLEQGKGLDVNSGSFTLQK